MTPVTAPGRDSGPHPAEARRGLDWLRRDEGWAPGEGAARLVIAILVALGAVGLKLVMVHGFGGELGYLSYVGAVVLGAWIAGLRGGLITTGMCAVAEIALFADSRPASAGIVPAELLRVGLFLFDGVLVSLITSGLRRATYRERLTRAEREAHFEAELAAHQAAEQDRLALQRLQAVTASLASAATPTEVADAILDRGLTALAADAGGVSRISADGTELAVIAARGYPPEETRPGTIFQLDRNSHLNDAMRGTRPVFIGNPNDWVARYPTTPPHPLPGSPTGGAIAILPLVSAGRLLGAVVFRFAAERDFGDGTADLALRLAEQGAQALDRALAYDERIDVQARLTRIAGDERRQAAELRAVIQAMGEGILVVDPSGRITLANDAAAEILGELPANLADLAPAFGDLSLESHDEPTGPDRAMPSDEALKTVSLPDGRWVELATYPADLGGRLIEGAAPSTIVVVRDVTRVRHAEAAREAFLGVLSHELRTPVTTIFGYAKVLQRSSRREDRDEMLADIEVEADRLYRIVEDLLALSRVEGGMTIEGEPLLLQHLAGPVVASEAQRWTGIEFETDLPAGLPAVFGERTYVEQVLRNMVSNAGKYSPPDTVVTIAAAVTPTEVEIRVLDRGAGIRSDEADRLFDLYYRSPTTARTAAGAGIGLYVGRGLITAMGGRIWAQPRDGGGSEFGFSLPRCDEDPVTPPEEPGHSTGDALSTSVDAAP